MSGAPERAPEQRRAKVSGYGGYYAPIIGSPDSEITRTGRGTLLGEYMRRFWQPVCLSEELKDVPLAIRILGENLVAFRDKSGDLGVLARQCAHRGASLEYGIIAEHGIRCCYHGWNYAVDGTLIDAPGEPKNTRLKETVCQGAYPVFERHGLVFAYMGPPEAKPTAPVYEPLVMPADNHVVAFSNYLPCNWLQVHENIADQAHAVFLHSGMTIDPNAKPGEGAQLNASFGQMPTLEWYETGEGRGMVFVAGRRIGQRIWIRINDLILPNITQHAYLFEDGKERKVFAHHINMTRWSVPVDDEKMQLFGWRFFNDLVDPFKRGDPSKCGKEAVDFLDGQVGNRPYEEGQRNPGDWEVLTSQGKIAIHELENPGTTDAGVYLWRKLLRGAIRGSRPAASPEQMSRYAAEKSPVPLYSQDSVLDIPIRSGEDDKKLIRDVGRRVLEIIRSGDQYSGSERVSHISAGIAALERSA